MVYKVHRDEIFWSRYDPMFSRCCTWLAFMTAARVNCGGGVNELEFIMGQHARVYDVVRTQVWRQIPGH